MGVGQLSTYHSASLAQTGGAELIASGGASSLFGIANFESRFAERDVSRLTISMRLIPPGTTSGLQRLMDLTPGIERVGPVTTEPGRVVVIRVRKGLAQLALLAGVLIVFFVGAILLLVTSWALFREPPGTSFFDFNPTTLLIIGGVALGAVVLGGRRRVTG